MSDPTLFDYSMIKGTVDAILFQNTDNFYTVLKVDTIESNEKFDSMPTVVGFLPNVVEGDVYTFKGQVVQHPRYGKQLKAETFEKELPQTKEAIISYLSSDLFKGIGKKTAQNIVNTLGENAINDILTRPEILESVPSLPKKKQKQIADQINANQESEKIMIRLHDLGFGPKLSMAIYQFYMGDTLNVLDKNPYQLVYDIKGIGFNKADQLARNVGIEPHSPERLKAALLFTLEEECIKQGHTYLPRTIVIETTQNLLNEDIEKPIETEQLLEIIDVLSEEKKLISEADQVSIPSLYYSELKSVQNLYRINTYKNHFKIIEQSDLQIHIGEIEDQNNVNYAKSQQEALETAMNSKIMLLTGGPGTGKTTVINGIIEAYSELHHIDLNKNDIPIVLAAPTGRAARRMNELTGLPSATIHRHLGLNGDSDYQSLDDYLDCSLIIIDEFSMVDTWLANQLFDALDSHTQVIIVGDSDQLPSVGPGQVLADLLNINALPHVKLEKIFRQSEESTIVTLANQMRQGFLPEDFTAKKADRSYFEASANIIPNMISKIVQSALKSGIEAHEIQILAPMYRGQAGINNLNLIMQNLLNPLKDNNQFTFNDINFRIGDKVLHLVNDTELNVFNGDIGYITDLIPAKYTESKQDEIYMTFDGQEVIYQRKEWLKITLAYAMSIHKSQGSEFQVVILPITRQSGRMLQRNLIYTAITRSKSKLILLGEIGAFDFAVKNEGAKRNTYLIERFENKQEIANSQKIEDSSIDQKIDNTIINTSIPKTATPIEQTNLSKITYRLTEENYLTIDPMIGINQQDISAIFDSK
ncbi:MAG: ATP-dependent RecD-like DNA helicase [Staphylococcus epidermidis]|nr:MAG: ATP-dependent RecD-like DNA helicase [Staphylococcus epidermidis]